MKKLLALILALSFVLPCILTSCNNAGNGDNTTDTEDTGNSDTQPNDSAQAKNIVEITDDFVIAYNPYIVSENSLAKKFARDFEDKFGIKLKTKDYTSDEYEYEIQIGTLSTRDEYKQARELMDEYATAGIGVALIRATDNTLTITGSSDDAVKVALEQAYETLFVDSASYDKTVDELIIFDARAYSEDRRLVGYTLAEVSSFADVYAFSVNGKTFDEFHPDIHEYTCNVTFAQGYPEITVTPLAKKANVTYEPPTDENNGIATVTVTSEDGANCSVYKINVNMNYNYKTNAEIVNKGGKAGTVCFVIDDGGQGTASFVKNKMFKKYPNLKATFAVMVKDLAILQTAYDSDNKEYYVTDAEGNYVYTPKTDNVEFWKDMIATGQADVVSHSFTHSYWGENDDGGSFVYTLNDGTTTTSKVFPKGSVTMELNASAQIVREQLGIDAYTYILPGVGAKLSQYYYNLLHTCGTYIGARTCNGSPKNPKAMLNFAQNMTTTEARFNVKAYMIEHYDTSAKKKTDKDSEPFECLTADIDYWTDYIDSAADNGAFACFCLHDIEANDYKGSNHHIYQAQADMLFGYACERDDLWIATFDEAVIYYSEWSTANLEAITYRDESVTVRLTDAERDDIYDHPLTVKVDIPDNWEEVSVTQNETEQRYTVVHTDDGSYVYVDIVPDVGDALIKPISK